MERLNTNDTLKFVAALVIAFFLLGFLFRILFKVGMIALLILGILYLYKKVFKE